MTTGTFDTLTAARELEAAGVERRQAEAIAKTIRSGQGELATKADIAAVKSDIGAVKSEVAALKWIVGIQGAISLATFAAVLFLAARLMSGTGA
ncbi:MAG: hypothetical protein OXC25_08220 [Thiotrichales bacterium]|nr:hypothetical protein [Thiotrichales bacterium]MCY4286959.1 hypothetical protein [Thiotrichales bacterium]MCY4349819.1 hypothetical protein [Thiotrichales bacterium]